MLKQEKKQLGEEEYKKKRIEEYENLIHQLHDEGTEQYDRHTKELEEKIIRKEQELQQEADQYKENIQRLNQHNAKLKEKAEEQLFLNNQKLHQKINQLTKKRTNYKN